MTSSPPWLGREATPAVGAGRHHGDRLAAIAEMREAHISVARVMGDDSLAASLGTLKRGVAKS